MVEHPLYYISRFKYDEITCPTCKEKFISKFWHAVNANDDPHLKKQVLNGDIFLHTCPQCNKVSRFDHMLRYHDTSKNAIIWFVFNDEEIKAVERMMSEMQLEEGHKNRLVKDQLDLKEKAMILDANLDDRVVEIMKQFIVLLHVRAGKRSMLRDISFDCGNPHKFVWVEMISKFCTHKGDFTEEKFREQKFEIANYRIVLDRMGSAISEASCGRVIFDTDWATDLIHSSESLLKCFIEICTEITVNNNIH